MGRIIGRTLALATVLGTLAAGHAYAAVTETAVTSPVGPRFDNPDTDNGGTPLQVSGTTNSTNTAADKIEIRCAYDDGNQDSGGALTGPVSLAADGSFTTQIDLDQLSYYICHLIAVPVGAPMPYDLTKFVGPVLGTGGFSRNEISGGPNDGKLYDFFQASSALQGYWSVYSAGDCYIGDSYPTNPVTFAYDDDRVFGCARLRQNLGPAGKDLSVDGRTALLPYGQTNVVPAAPIAQAADIPGFQAISGFDSSIDPSAGDMTVTSTEPTSFCDPDPTACETFVPTGIRLDAKTTAGTLGRTLTIEHDWVNTTGQSKDLHAGYEVRSDAGAGWWFPFAGEPGYTSRAGSDTVTPPTGGPGTFFLRDEPAITCGAANDCGSVTWAEPPSEIFFTSPQVVLLGFDRTIPPGCQARIAFTFSHGRVQSSVDTYATAAEAALASEPSITCPPPSPPPGSPPSGGGAGAAPPPAAPAKKKKCKKHKKKHRSAESAKKNCKKKKKRR